MNTLIGPIAARLTSRPILTAEISGDNVFGLDARRRENPIEEFVPDTQRLAFGFFWLPGDDPFRLVALKARVFIERGVARITDRRLVGQLLVMRFARTRRTKIGHFSSVFIDQQQVLVGMSLVLAAVMHFLQLLVCRALPSPFRAVNR